MFTAVTPVRLDEVDENTSTDYCGQSAFEWSKLIGERYVEYYARQTECSCLLSFGFRPSLRGLRMETIPALSRIMWNRSNDHLPIRLPAGVDPVRDILYVDDFSRACRHLSNRKLSLDFITWVAAA